MKLIKKAAAAAVSLLASAVAFADVGGALPGTVPEPGSLALVGLAIGVAVVVARRGKK